MRSRPFLNATVLTISLLAVHGSAVAQDLLIDTGQGSSTQFPATSCFNNAPNFQYIGMQIVLASAEDIGRVDAWMTGFGSVNVKLYTNSGTNFPGTELESATFGPLANNNTPSWRIFSGLDWSVAAGTYWITFEVDPSAGNHAFQPGVANPLPKYAFLANGNPGWASLGGTTKLGLRVWTPAPPEPVLVPSEFATIQDAIDFVADDQIIEVAPGTYNEAINFSGKTIEVRSSGGPEVTVIDATGLNQPAVTVLGSGLGTRLEGFTITGGSHLTSFAQGGGLFAQSDMTVENCIFTNNTAESGGGASVTFGAEVTFESCVFDDNHIAEDDFGSGAGAYVNDATAHFSNCTFINNDVPWNGGAVNVNVNGLGNFTNCLFKNNTALNVGGAVTVINSTADANFTGCVFEENVAPAGGGVTVNSADVDFIDCDFIENEATHNAAGGGGLHVQSGAIIVINGCDFIGNSTNHAGGGVQFFGFSGSGSITNSRFRHNDAVVAGGGLHVNGTAPSVSGTEFCDNSPGHTLGTFTDAGGNTFTATCIPDNDDSENPEPIAPDGGTVTATLEGASNSGTSSCEPDGADVFFQFTISNGPVNILIDTCGSLADTALAVFDSGDAEIGCATTCGGNPCGGDAACLGLADLANGDYLIRVSLESGAVAGSALDFVLNINEAELLVPGDFNNDLVVDETDAALFCGTLGSSTGDGEFIEAADFDQNGTINHLDQQAFNKILPGCGGDIVTSETFAPPADGTVDAADLAYLLGAWGNQPSCADTVTSRTFAPPPDGKVDAADLAFLLGAWGGCP